MDRGAAQERVRHQGRGAGAEPDLKKKVKIHNRLVRWCGEKLEYEEDSRHAEVLRCRAARTPGVHEAKVD